MTNRHASIPLTEPTEIVGEWYLPDQPDRIASGRLLYDPEDGLFLETISDVPLLLGRGSAPILLGVAVDGRLVTLRDVDQLSERFSAPGGSSLRASVRTAFVGMHAETPEALRLHSVDARLSHLTDWCSKPGIDVRHTTWPHGGVIQFGAPPTVVLAKTAGATFAVTFDFVGERDPASADGAYEVSLEQQAWLTIQPRGSWRYDEFDRLLTQVRWFFGFAAGAQDRLLELRGHAPVVRRTFGPKGRRFRVVEPVWILFGRPRLQSPEARAATEMLFLLPDLAADHTTRPLTRWLNLCRRLSMEPVFGPYFATLARDTMYLDVRFLLFAQIAEAYHSRRRPARTHYERRIGALVAAMPRQLRQRIPPTFANEVKHTRNYLTHRDMKSFARAATGARLFALAELLKLTFDVAILHELGFAQAEITNLVDRNPRVSQTVRQALQILAETTPGR